MFPKPKVLKKNHLCGFEHLQSNGAIPIDLDLHYQGQSFYFSCFANISQTVRDREIIAIDIREKDMYLLSNCEIANVVHRDIGIYFQDHKISENHIIFNIWRMMRASE